MNNLGLYLTINGVGIIILVLMLVNFGMSIYKKPETDDRIFRYMIYTNIVLLISDTLMWALVGYPNKFMRIGNEIATSIYFIAQPVMCFLWLVYCEYKIVGKFYPLRKKIPFYLIPVFILTALTIASYFYPIVFTINAQNVYTRAPYYFVFVIIIFSYFVYSTYITFKAYKNTTIKKAKRDLKFLFIYPIFPVIGALLQAVFFGLATTWIASVISLLILYFNLQNVIMTTDPLSGVSNRYHFESYMNLKLNGNQENDYLFLAMIDIDNLKVINDECGHNVGDQAIKSASSILNFAANPEDFVARIGGDEFVVIGERKTLKEVKNMRKMILDHVQKVNNRENFDFHVSLSIGIATKKLNQNKELDDLLLEADLAMYEDKKRENKSEAIKKKIKKEIVIEEEKDIKQKEESKIPADISFFDIM